MKLFFYLFGLLALTTFASLSVGPSGFSAWELITNDLNTQNFIFELRLNRTLAALFVGGLLALSGVYLQTLLRNPLAEPYTLGLSGGASLGAVLGVLLGAKFLSVSLFSFFGAWAVALIITWVSRSKSLRSSKTIILFGIMISFFCGSVVSLIASLLDHDKLSKVYVWMLGQVGTALDTYWPAGAFALLIGMTWGLLNVRRLDLLLIDEDVASSREKRVISFRILLILIVTLMTSVSVALTGLIGFVGIVVPHIAKLLISSSRHKKLIPVAAVLGGVFLVAADTLGRLVSGVNEVPAGGITALIGSPILVYLLTRARRAA